jgi:hypothetical protein
VVFHNVWHQGEHGQGEHRVVHGGLHGVEVPARDAVVLVR